MAQGRRRHGVGQEVLDQSKPPLNDLICFHCQQSAEKYLKAFVQEFGLVVPATHILEDLLLLLDSSRLGDQATSSQRRVFESVCGRVPLSRKDCLQEKGAAALRHAESVRRSFAPDSVCLLEGLSRKSVASVSRRTITEKI